MSEYLHLDLESRGVVDLRKVNVYVYAEHPDTDIICARFAFGAAEPEVWLPGQPAPPKVVEHVKAGKLIATP